MMELEQNNNPLWDVRLEMLKDYMYTYKGQFLDEVVQAPDKQSAILRALRHNEMTQEQIDIDIVKVLSVIQWTDNGKTL